MKSNTAKKKLHKRVGWGWVDALDAEGDGGPTSVLISAMRLFTIVEDWFNDYENFLANDVNTWRLVQAMAAAETSMGKTFGGKKQFYKACKVIRDLETETWAARGANRPSTHDGTATQRGD